MVSEKHYSMFRATTDKLDEQLNGAVEAGWKIESITWVGGRDWVIITTVVPNTNGSLPVSDVTPVSLVTINEYISSLIVDARTSDVARILKNVRYMLDTLINQTHEGWVDNMNRRHRRFDDSNYCATTSDTPVSFSHLIDPEIEWGDIVYGRYDTNRVPTGNVYVGWIEDRAKSWIIFLGEHGSPSLYWPRRDERGGVIGEAIKLAS